MTEQVVWEGMSDGALVDLMRNEADEGRRLHIAEVLWKRYEKLVWKMIFERDTETSNGKFDADLPQTKPGQKSVTIFQESVFNRMRETFPRYVIGSRSNVIAGWMKTFINSRWNDEFRHAKSGAGYLWNESIVSDEKENGEKRFLTGTEFVEQYRKYETYTAVAETERERVVRKVVRQLALEGDAGLQQSEVLTMTFFRQMEMQEIADHFEVEIKTVWRWKKAGLRRLGEILKEGFGVQTFDEI